MDSSRYYPGLFGETGILLLVLRNTDSGLFGSLLYHSSTYLLDYSYVGDCPYLNPYHLLDSIPLRGYWVGDRVD